MSNAAVVSSRLSNLRSKESRLVSESAALIAAGLRSAQDRARNEQILADLSEAREDIGMLEQTARALPSTAPVAAPTVIFNSIGGNTEGRRAKLDAAYRQYLATGKMSTEFRDLATTTDAAGGAVIAQDYDAQWVEAAKQYGPLANLVSVTRIKNGVPIKIAISNDTATAMSYIPETNSSTSVETDPVLFSTVAGGADTLASSVAFSKQEAADAEDIGAFLKSLAYGRAARAIEYALLTGTDSGTQTQLPHSPSGGLLAQAPVGVSGVALTGPTYAQMAALAASVDVAYRNAPEAGFYVNPTTFAFLVDQVTTTGAPLYSFGDDGLLRVVGKPVYVSAANAMASYSSATSPIVLFGAYSKALRFVDVGGVRLRVFTERYADQLLNLAQITQRMSAATLVSGAVKSMTTT